MNSRILGRDLKVSAIGLGCMGFSHAYGAPTEGREAVRAIRAAFDLGYTCSTRPRSTGPRRTPMPMSAWWGRPWRAYGTGADRQQVRDPLRYVQSGGEQAADPRRPARADPGLGRGVAETLRTDHIDLYLQHRVDPQVAPETVAQVMAELIREGKILHWGISEAGEEYLRRAHAVCPVTAVEDRYSMMARQHEALFPVLEELEVGLVAFSPMANGLLTGAYGRDDRFDPELDYRSAMPQFARRRRSRTGRSWTCSGHWRRRKTPRRDRSLWPGCCARSPGSSPSPAAGRWSGCGRTPERRK